MTRMPINRPAKFDATSFIVDGQIRNRTNTQNYKQTSTSVFGGTAVYPHMPGASILPIDASSLHWRRERRQWRGLASIGNTCRRASIRRILGFWGSKIPQSGRFHAQDAHVQNLTLLALSPAKKSVAVQNNKITNKQTVTDLSTLGLSACVEMTTNDWSWTKIV